MKKKYIIFVLTILAIVISTFCWDKINITYDVHNKIYGEYAKNYYNPINDTIRFIFFISLTLITFLFSYLIFNKEDIFSLK